ncbi:wax ester/triacylglycerol synthase family O-acyltransferase [Salinisphaera sp. Q1T1-3]|uniref:WS/DGAT/MGAT family O-acyltransferase n=1 Tax=Salinisphaera sp. Q1T1-3 TaxID=2321229 RepID=UPI000E741CE2|nr:wax ester/triacylglycerol synthase family O-acyltransferase [Salinisphaera sp. Q1T1-3]RJS92485.1 wax ester/triacylglycerol synthase family O-acyltransferase [Salinisphaera sp. Q1T1-3]
MTVVDPIGQLFLHLERRNQPMHVGGLQLFELPDDAPVDYVRRLVERARRFDMVQPPFDRRLVQRLGQSFWRADTGLDLEYHVRHLALPAAGAIRDLLALVSMLHGALLDRARPLWEMYIIEGVADHRFAIYTKFHHAMMDGVSAMRLMHRFVSQTPDAETVHMPWSLPRKRSRQTSGRLADSWQTIQAGARQALALPSVPGALYQSWHDARQDADFTGPMRAPACMLNRPISGSRRVAAQGYSLTRIRAVAARFDATVNDIVLAMCASALRAYLIDNDGLPARPLIALVPMSLHDDKHDATGNKVGAIYTNLATNVADPLDRLSAIQRSVAYWKRRYKTMSPAQIMAFTATLSAPAGLNLLTGAAPRHQAFNVVISNVPGPAEPRYLGEARMVGMYPLSVVLDGQALNISLTSYADAIEFGLIACRRSVPSMQNLLQYLGEALDALDDASSATEPPPPGTM